MNKQFVMLSGIPRSGSTLLSSVLNQHPLITATTTSPVSELLLIFENNWPHLEKALLNPHPDQYKNIVRGIIDNAYLHEESDVIVDKNRIWPKIAKLLSESLGQKPKIICTVRDIPDVLASYILLLEKNPGHLFVDGDLMEQNLPLNTKNRCKILWEKYVNYPYTSLRVGYNSKCADMLFVDYNEIVGNTQETMNKICEFIGINTISVNTSNVQSMSENDDYHGGLKGLHEVRPEVKKTSPSPEQVIGHDLVKLYSNMKLEFWKK